MIGRLPLFAIAVTTLVTEAHAAKPDDSPKQIVEITDTEQIDFPANGVLRFKKSSGDLTIEGWDRPEVEITTVKSTKHLYDAESRLQAGKELQKVKVTPERHGDELVITTLIPSRLPAWLPKPAGLDLAIEYMVKAPWNARISLITRKDRSTFRMYAAI
jgi:hypothetical protein